MLKYIFSVALVGVLMALSACSSTPPAWVKPVQGFDASRYLGKWYEIARLDHSFERGLSQVSAEYGLRPDGDIQVINRGYQDEKQAWQQAEGRAKFLGAKDVGQLQVSFFGPLYGGYNIIELDRDYQYALVVGNDFDYLWILARDPNLDTATRQRLVDKARQLGFPVDRLLLVKHGQG